MLLALALAAVSITPPYQELDPYGGMCGGKVRIYVPSHPDNRTLRVEISDGYEGGALMSETSLDTRPEEQIRSFSIFKDGHLTFTAFVEGPNRKVRGVAVARVQCGKSKSTGGV